MNAYVELAAPAFIPGLFRNMPSEQYFAVEALSASGAKKMIRSPQHYRLERDRPSEPTPQMAFGQAVHCGVLEAHRFDQCYVEAPAVDKRTKEGKSAWAEFVAQSGGRTILSSEDYMRVLRCTDAVLGHPAASRLLEDTRREVSLFWTDGKYKVPCKARFDALGPGIVDVKTTIDASPEAFGRQCASLLYTVQGAHYMSGAEHALNRTPDYFALIAVESEEPHGVACYWMDTAAIMSGAHLMDIALQRYADALKSGQWPGYPSTIERLSVPRWALRHDV